MDVVARRIRSRRRSSSSLRAPFSARIGLTRNMVIRYERGQTVPRAAVLARIARERRVTVEWLLGGADGQGRRHRAWEQAVADLRAVWSDAEKRRLMLEVLRRVR